MLSDPVIASILASVASVLASAGFWGWLQARDKKKSALSRVVRGLAYDKIVTLGMAYIERGWISREEYEDFQNHFFEPYKALGGNGVADQVMRRVSDLPMGGPSRYAEINQQNRKNVELTNER